jgi:hypothetical protein
MGSFPGWAYAQSVLKIFWDSGFVRPRHSSGISDPLLEVTPALGYSRQGKRKKRGKGEKQMKITQH